MNFLESKKPLPMDKMLLKALDKDLEAGKEKSMTKKRKLEDQARMIQMAAHEQLDALLTDPLEELYSLWEEEKPLMQDEEPSGVGTPNEGNFEHPVTQQRKQVDSAIEQGMNPVEAHQSVYGDVETGSAESKKKLASTLGRVQDDGNRRAVTLEPEKGSILSKDAELENDHQVTRDDLRTPMNKEVPDDQQTPMDQVAEEFDYQEEMDYNDDVAYLQKYGRA